MADQDRRVRTIEVAALAQASPSTVSRALAGDKRISEATRDRVLAAAEKLNYRPNLIARGLKNSSTGIIGVIVTDLDNPYHAHALKTLIDELGNQGLAPLVFACNTTDTAGAVISRLMSFQVDAVIGLAAPFNADIVHSCRAGGKPLVLMNAYEGQDNVSTVAGDGAAGGALAAAHLASRGAQRFGFFAGEDGTTISIQRERGYREGLAKLGHHCAIRVSGRYDYPSARIAARKLLAERPGAVFCANDTLAFALIDEARLRGFAIPGDLMVVGYDNSSSAAWAAYDLTSIDQNLSDLVAETVSTTRAVVARGQAVAICKTVPPTLVLRGSTGS